MSPKAKKASSEAGTARKRRLALVVPIPGAARVVAIGDFNDWSAEGVELRKRRDGAWSATLSLVPGRYEYRLFVDGEWRNNPAAESRVANAFGTENDLLIVP
jgi:1,4-alpha-glucan branching enzyme